MSTITFFSDFGHADEFVGVVHSVIRELAPDVAVIDLAHDIEAHDVRGGGLLLARAAQYLAPGVVLGVVDPGVGTDRNGVIIEVGGGQSYLVGPDNGLFAPAVSLVGGATAAWVLDKPEHHLASPGPTFAGRDIFAPVAAALCTGTAPSVLGTPLPPERLLPGVLPLSQQNDDGSLSAEVLWVDRFGNAQLNLDPNDLTAWGDAVVVQGERATRTASRAVTYGEIPTGGVGLVVDSYGLVSVAVDRGSAALELGLNAGAAVSLRPAEHEPSVRTPVELRPRTERPGEG